MKIYRGKLTKDFKNISSTLGSFDGLHLGHQKLIKDVVAESPESLLVTFYPHPLFVLQKDTRYEYLTTYRQKFFILKKLGLKSLNLIRFSKELATTRATDFIKEYILDVGSYKAFNIGEDATVGVNREGNAQFIKDFLSLNGVECKIHKFVMSHEHKISSRDIKTYIKEGEVKKSANLLGRPYSILSRCVKGKGLGSKIGFATANFSIKKQLLPKHGVYATISNLDGKLYKSVTSIGINPTVSSDKSEIKMETHLLDYQVDVLYLKYLEVFFIDRIREEIKFRDLEELKVEIAKDCQIALNLITVQELTRIEKWIS